MTPEEHALLTETYGFAVREMNDGERAYLSTDSCRVYPPRYWPYRDDPLNANGQWNLVTDVEYANGMPQELHNYDLASLLAEAALRGWI